MLITRRSDYALRIIRVLKDGDVHNVRERCEKEDIPRAFTYKILRELEQAELVRSERGNKGGYYLAKSLDNMTLFDIINFTEDGVDLMHCMKEGCDRNTLKSPCMVHRELERIQGILIKEMKSKPLSQVIEGE